jgi:transcription initiation factor TFIIB
MIPAGVKSTLVSETLSATASVCPECSGAVVATEGERICEQCGLVVAADDIDRGPEWYADDTEKKRAGAPLTRQRHDRGLSTRIGYDGETGSARKRRQLERMRRQHNRGRIRSKAERNQMYAFTEIQRLAESLGVPDGLREQACALFESAQSADLIRGRSLEGFAAATVYAVCRIDAIARTTEEIVDAAKADSAECRAAYDALNRELGLPTGPIDPVEYLPRFADQLDVPDVVEQRARHLARLTQEEGIAGGRQPSGIAAGCLYTAAREHGHDLTQARAAAVADVSPVTLRGTYHDLCERDTDGA